MPLHARLHGGFDRELASTGAAPGGCAARHDNGRWQVAMPGAWRRLMTGAMVGWQLRN